MLGDQGGGPDSCAQERPLVRRWHKAHATFAWAHELCSLKGREGNSESQVQQEGNGSKEPLEEASGRAGPEGKRAGQRGQWQAWQPGSKAAHRDR